MIEKTDKQNIGNAGEYFAASILSAHGFTTTLTLGRAEKYDILAVTPNGKTIKIQVKTLSGNGDQFRMSPKDGNRNEHDLFYFFVRLNELKKSPEYWIFPSKIVADYIPKNYNKWLTSLGKLGQKHNDNEMRTFRVKTDKYTPKNWTEFCKKYYAEKGLNLLKVIVKRL